VAPCSSCPPLTENSWTSDARVRGRFRSQCLASQGRLPRKSRNILDDELRRTIYLFQKDLKISDGRAISRNTPETEFARLAREAKVKSEMGSQVEIVDGKETVDLHEIDLGRRRLEELIKSTEQSYANSFMSGGQAATRTTGRESIINLTDFKSRNIPVDLIDDVVVEPEAVDEPTELAIVEPQQPSGGHALAKPDDDDGADRESLPDEEELLPLESDTDEGFNDKLEHVRANVEGGLMARSNTTVSINIKTIAILANHPYDNRYLLAPRRIEQNARMVTLAMFLKFG
jgi:hypothetical protein